MVWDASKSPGDLITSSDWNSMVTDQKGHSTRHESGGGDEIDIGGLSASSSVDFSTNTLLNIDFFESQSLKASAPSSPSTGDWYIDDGSNTNSGNTGFRVYDSGAWVDIGSGSSVSDSGTQVLSAPTDINFANALSVTDDSDGTVSVDVGSGSIQASELDLSISPTWTSTHTFSSGAVVESSLDMGPNASITDVRTVVTSPNIQGYIKLRENFEIQRESDGDLRLYIPQDRTGNIGMGANALDLDGGAAGPMPIINMADPTSAQDAATKSYVDDDVNTVSSSYTTSGEDTIFADVSGSSLTVTLASSDAVSGNKVRVMDKTGNAGTNNITVATGSSETINGETDAVINSDYEALTFQSDGSNWFIVGRMEGGNIV